MAKFLYLIVLNILLFSSWKVQASDCEILKPLYLKWVGENEWKDNCCEISMKVSCQNQKIQKIDFSLNGIKTKIKEEDVAIIKSLKSLKALDLSFNSMYGNLPENFSDLSLNSIDLSNNDFTGPVVRRDFDSKFNSMNEDLKKESNEDFKAMKGVNKSVYNGAKGIIKFVLIAIIIVVVLIIALTVFGCIYARRKSKEEEVKQDEYVKQSLQQQNGNVPPLPYAPSGQENFGQGAAPLIPPQPAYPSPYPSGNPAYPSPYPSATQATYPNNNPAYPTSYPNTTQAAYPPTYPNAAPAAYPPY